MAVSTEFQVHWTEAREFLCRRLRHELRGRDRDDLQDLTQEALTRLLRAIRRDGARSLEALMTAIARRTAIDHFRRRRWAAQFDPLPDVEGGPGTPAGPAPDEFGDPVERLRFVVLEFFAAHGSACHELALAFFDRRDWHCVARGTGRNYEAVRRQWTRCVSALRSEARRSPGRLTDWASSDGGGKP